MHGLTKRQREIIDFIQKFIANHRYSPSYREIGTHFGFSSVASVHKHVNTLKKKGIVLAEKKSSRSLVLSQEKANLSASNEIEVPFIGHLVAGTPIQMFSQSQMLAIPKNMVNALDKTYVLRVQGDSLNEEMIADGDFLVVEARQEAHPGETVVALINHHDTVVKRYYPENDYIRLASNNPHQHPIILRSEDMIVQGVLVSMLRKFG